MRRRIVHYYPGAAGHSGVTFALWSWARAQARSGAEVCVLHAPGAAENTSVRFVPGDHCAGLTSHPVPHAGRGRATQRPVGLERYLGRDDLLVLHEGWVTSNLVAAAAARRARVPYIVMPHGVYERAWMRYLKPPLWLRQQLERRLLEGAAAVHVFFASEIADAARIAPSAAFITVPTGFDVPESQWTGGGGYLAWIGRIDPVHKGLDTLAAAVASLPPSRRPRMRLRGYDYKGGVERLRRVIAACGVGRWIQVDGPLGGADKMRFLQQADGYVHPSRWECHSMALLENLALGVPCLVSRRIHIAPTLEQSSAAVLADPREPAIAAGLSTLADERPAIAPRGRALIAHAFNWERLIPQFEQSLARLGVQS